MAKLTRRELWLLFLVSTLLMAWSSMPDWAGYSASNEATAFGGAYFDPQDYAVHVAMIRAGMQGEWGYHIRFTTEAHSTAYLRMFYILLGELNRLLGIPPDTLFLVARWLFGYLALFSIYMLARRCFGNARWQWFAFLLAVLGSGLGWLQRIFGWVPGHITPIDFWLIDGYVLFSLSLFPHFALTIALMCLAWVWFLNYLDTHKPVWVGCVIAAAWVVQIVNPLAFVLVDIAIATSAFVHWMRQPRPRGLGDWSGLALVAIAQVPIFLYTLSVLTQWPVWMQFTAQDQTLSPPPIYYLAGYALFWPLALVGAVDAFRERGTILIAALAWIVAAFTLAYAPFNIQRRFLLGITIPLALVSTHGLRVLLDRVTRKQSWLSARIPTVAIAVGLLTSTTTLIIMPAHAFYMRTQPAEEFYPRELDSAFAWLSTNSQLDDFVLSAPRTAQLIAQKTGRRVFAGHEMETIDYASKAEMVTRFYSGRTAPGWLEQYPVKWIVYGPYEQAISPHFTPPVYLRLVYESGGVRVYRNLRAASP